MNKQLTERFNKAKKHFKDSSGDHLSLLNIFNKFNAKYKDNKPEKLDEWCYKYFLKKNTLLKAMKIKKNMHRNMKRRINRNDLNDLGFNLDKNFKPELRALLSFVIGFRLNIIKNIKEHEVPKSSFLNKSNNIVYYKKFNYMENLQYNIISTIPKDFIKYI